LTNKRKEQRIYNIELWAEVPKKYGHETYTTFHIGLELLGTQNAAESFFLDQNTGHGAKGGPVSRTAC